MTTDGAIFLYGLFTLLAQTLGHIHAEHRCMMNNIAGPRRVRMAVLTTFVMCFWPLVLAGLVAYGTAKFTREAYRYLAWEVSNLRGLPKPKPPQEVEQDGWPYRALPERCETCGSWKNEPRR